MNKSIVSFVLIVLIAVIVIASLTPSILHIIFNIGIMVIIIVVAYIFYKIGRKAAERKR